MHLVPVRSSMRIDHGQVKWNKWNDAGPGNDQSSANFYILTISSVSKKICFCIQ